MQRPIEKINLYTCHIHTCHIYIASIYMSHIYMPHIYTCHIAMSHIYHIYTSHIYTCYTCMHIYAFYRLEPLLQPMTSEFCKRTTRRQETIFHSHAGTLLSETGNTASSTVLTIRTTTRTAPSACSY